MVRKTKKGKIKTIQYIQLNPHSEILLLLSECLFKKLPIKFPTIGQYVHSLSKDHLTPGVLYSILGKKGTVQMSTSVCKNLMSFIIISCWNVENQILYVDSYQPVCLHPSTLIPGSSICRLRRHLNGGSPLLSHFYL